MMGNKDKDTYKNTTEKKHDKALDNTQYCFRRRRKQLGKIFITKKKKSKDLKKAFDKLKETKSKYESRKF